MATIVTLLVLGLGLLLPGPAIANEAFWTEIGRGGVAILIRHTRAPGTGDPPGFRAGDCATQRNLDAVGRSHARRIGDAFRARGITPGRVLASRWCRAQDTAREMDIGPVTVEAALDSLFHDASRTDEQVAALKRLVGMLAPTEVAVLATHSYTVRALAGVSPAEGEMVAIRVDAGGGVRIVGRLLVP